MRMSTSEARARFRSTCSARLATVRPDGAPHIVPIVFALDGDRLAFAVDAKPKSTVALQRLANIASQPRVSVLVDEYADDWSQLWWARADGRAAQQALDDDWLARLAERYPQYAGQPPPGPLVVVEVERWTGWRAAT